MTCVEKAQIIRPKGYYITRKKPIQHFVEPAFILTLKRRLPTLPLLRSTIGVTRLNFSVRNGKRWIPRAITTLSSFLCIFWTCRTFRKVSKKTSFTYWISILLTIRKFRAISTARLRHYWPYTCSLSTSSSLTTLVRKSYLEVGFVLRCFQHLSFPDLDTRRCTWRYNR